MSLDRRSMLTFALAGGAFQRIGRQRAGSDHCRSGIHPVVAAGTAGRRAAADQRGSRRARAPGAPLRDRLVRRVTRPGISVVRAAEPDGSAVLIIPGGAYQHVVIDKEGLKIAQWMAARGTTAALLRYRLPGDGWKSCPDAPLADAQRALRLLRSHAAQWYFDAAARRRVAVRQADISARDC